MDDVFEDDNIIRRSVQVVWRVAYIVSRVVMLGVEVKKVSLRVLVCQYGYLTYFRRL